MAETKNSVAPAPPRAAVATRPDLATLIGVILALSGIIGGLILEKGSLSDILQGTAALIVLGGTLGAVLVSTPMSIMIRACAALRDVVLERSHSYQGTIDEIIRCAGKARREGIVGLETDCDKISDPFLRKALTLAVDGTDLQELRSMMQLEIAMGEHNCEAEAKVWEAAGGYAPTVGIIGAVLGLIQVMKRLDDIKEVGHGIAVAFVATVYGVGVANIFFLPFAAKLKARGSRATILKELMLEGVVGIVEGLNPTLIRLKLEAFAQERSRKASSGPETATPSAVKKSDVAA